MSLATRLLTFFLMALALVLVGFSVSLYVLAQKYLVQQTNDRLRLALDTLEAAVDIEPGGLEWEPADRHITLGLESGVNAVRWGVCDGTGHLIDRSSNANTGFPISWRPTTGTGAGSHATAYGSANHWRLAGRRLELGELLKQGRGHPDDEPGYEVQYRELWLVAGLSPLPVETTLKRLGLTLAVLSAVVWTVAGLLGRWLVGRALLPIRRMARAATAMSTSDLGPLPTPNTGDELEELGRTFNDLLARLRTAFARLNDALDRQQRFAGDASHQLCNPLTALIGHVQLARRRDRTPAEYRDVLDRVHEEGNRLRQIVQSLLLLADPGGAEISLQEIDLAAWLPKHLERWSGHERAADVRLELHTARVLTARAEPELLAQVIDNLIDNALKYSPPGTPVTVAADRSGSEIGIRVEDHGCGLALHDRPHVFNAFYRAESARRTGRAGSGLGLAVGRRIALALGGSLELAQTAEPVTRFLLRLQAGSARSDESTVREDPSLTR